MTHFDIQIVSDTVCPWCYVGKNRLDAAINQQKTTHPSDTFSTSWHPFYLNPNASVPGIDKQAHYAAKFGSQRTALMQQHLARLGSQVGINFKFGGLTGNTRDSHRLIMLAGSEKGEQAQTRVVEELFKSYFEVNEDITDHAVLLSCATKAGLPDDEVKGWLESDRAGKEVDEEVKKAKEGFVQGVPNFTIQGRYEVQGAEEPGAFLSIFEKIREAGENGTGGKAGEMDGVVTNGNIC